MSFRAGIVPDPLGGTVAVHLVQEDGTTSYGPRETTEFWFSPVAEGAISTPLFRLPREALIAIADAVYDHYPPKDDKDLREALEIERGRVDRVLDVVLE